MYRCNETSQTAGFSVLELMVVMSVMLVVLASIFSLMGSSIKSGSMTYELTEAQQSLRSAQEYISRDLTTAGDGLKSINTIQVPTGFVQNFLTLTPIVDPQTPNYVNLGILTSDDGVPAGTPARQSNPPINVSAGTDRLTMLTDDSTFKEVPLAAGDINAAGSNITIRPTDAPRFNIGEIYCITSQTGAAFGTITSIVAGVNGANSTLVFAAGDTYGLNQPGNGGPINVVSQGGTLPTSLARIRIIHYFVDANRLLVRRVFGVSGAGFIDSVVAEHVSDMQCRYSLNVLDANGFVQQPVRRLATPQQQVGVREVEVTMTVQTAHAVSRGAPWPVTMTASTSVRNMQFRQALEPSSGG